MVLAQQGNKIFSIYGSSDDLIEANGLPGCDEFCHVTNNNKKVGVGRLQSKEETMLIYCYYENTGCWHFSPALAGEDIALPNWKINIRSAKIDEAVSGYTTILEIEVPPDTTFNMILT